ncbi:MBL fold metallo-hydrolase [Runella slithyformis]|uniref:Beta-lactamase-like protein n=1 Tax=Runella slithyformis (strain ATCC 29530 / DSM 19594 / LMG 11500 / NCIMB 11436 / LSU 4) TaxID=761193 RepID=A0A7U3ZR30_RUNSL|nr:MBL fold metallo-hydrolase [Runella slithyformis]AEI51816.1 beta-lactamase-like protein [Runella slithyformis DSM 19594]
MKQSEDSKFIPMTSVSGGKGREVCPDVFYYTNQIVNLIMVGTPGSDAWVLIDAGMPASGAEILAVVEERFGRGVQPSAILLTHGHFDHVGSIVDLLKTWKVPVWAHPLELPYLTGMEAYPEPDTSVEGGLLAKISFLYPHEPIDIREAVQPLPADGSVPGLPGWKWIHTPGHSPGHVSFFRESDRTLLSGDAFITVRQDSLYKVLIQKEEVNGPPRYLTTDWTAAWTSVRTLEALRPEVVVPGHGTAMKGEELRTGLQKLVNEFDTLAIPEYGKFVESKDDI